MNREERKQKRERDTKNAVIVFFLMLLFFILLIAAGVFALNRFVLKDKPPEEQPGETETEQPTGTDPVAVGEEPVQPEVTDPVIDPETQQAIDFVAGMSLEDKVAQMFVITPNALTGYGGVTVAGDKTRSAYNDRSAA